jgi:hypothetical protein
MRAPHLVLALATTGLLTACAQPTPDLADLPLVQPGDLAFVGAFRLPSGDFGASTVDYAQGPIALGPDGGTLYVVGHAHQQAIAEFAIPALGTGPAPADLPLADPPRQPFATVLERAASGNPQALDRIGGMLLVPGPDGPQLLVNAYVYYDAGGGVTHTTLALRDPGDLAGSPVDGPYAFDGGAGHTAGWLAPIPAAYRDALGGASGADHLTGHASGIPIISRSSVGPSAFAFAAAAFAGPPGPVPTTRLLDFALDRPLHPDLDANGDNPLWTHLSHATVGLIVPGTRTYLTLGHSGGHASGVCYKCTQSDGHTCGGYCARDADDVAAYAWAWDLLDLVAVREGRRAPHDVRPYAFGPLDLPLLGPERRIGGGAYDAASGLLYLTALGADDSQGPYAYAPLVVAVRVAGVGAR